MFGGGVDSAGVIADGRSYIFYADACGFESGERLLKFRLIPR